MQTVPHRCSSYEAFGDPVKDWAARLTAGLDRNLQASDHSLGHIEEEIAQQTRELERCVAQEVAQKKADQCSANCPVCGTKLRRVTRGHERTIETRFGPIKLKRSRGWCPRCKRWCFPADHALGIAETGSASPGVQEMAALLGSKMPITEASAVIKRLTGVDLPRATLDREAKRQGQRAERKREKLDEQMRTAEGARAQGRGASTAPFTLVIEIDAWNIRERDDWGQSQRQRAQGREPERWHWVYGATCFRLEDRLTKGQRAMILSRGTVMTRDGIEGLKSQLWAEAMRHGLASAARVLVLADGAVWIWNLVADRFEKAVQRLDLYHGKEHLWSVARTLYPEDPATARAWVKPLLKDLECDRARDVIATLEDLVEAMQGNGREIVEKEINYFGSNLQRMKYKEGKKRGEPLGSGAIESTCRQYQCRFKRPGQFWSRTGDEALMCLETFWRNGRWHLLFPHCALSDLSRN
ncbi:MAG TPA: ISKra4 family transposase [Pyrinomonadaceae bacterium]|nr:ISKra4 family transposase [Pyrinomonadaceae bacterium]